MLQIMKGNRTGRVHNTKEKLSFNERKMFKEKNYIIIIIIHRTLLSQIFEVSKK